MSRLRFLFLESFYGGSHRAFADGLVRYSAHRIDLVTMPAARWRRRYQTAAWELVERMDRCTAYDGIIATDLIDLADVRALMSEIGPVPPILLYMHESQTTYPPTTRRSPPRELLVIELKNVATADRILFNSHVHQNSFVAAIRDLTAGYTVDEGQPTARRLTETADRAASAAVRYPGVNLPRPPRPVSREGGSAGGGGPSVGGGTRRDATPLILWNHRWEYDKEPALFFRVLDKLQTDGYRFGVVLLGEESDAMRPRFAQAAARLGERLLQCGFVQSRQQYQTWLERADLVVSTAIQENFGIAVCEAVCCGCIPILPRRLSYPELVPRKLHYACLYDDEAGLYRRLVEQLLLPPAQRRATAAAFQQAFRRFDWQALAPQFDQELDRLARRAKPG